MRCPDAALLLLGLSSLLVACGDESATPKNAEGGGAVSSSSSAGGAGGAGGVPGPPSRGHTSEFPPKDACLATCVEACARLEACGGPTSPIFPIEKQECEVRCGVATKGPLWDDISGSFRCCASQAECSDVQHCGGWLQHPDPVASCEKLCTCFFSSASELLSSGRQAPEGLRFAPDAVMLAAAGPEARRLLAVRGVRGVDAGQSAGAPAIVHLDDAADQATLDELARAGRLLPTFLDGAGRLVAATGRVVISASSEAARASALTAAARRSNARVRRMRGRVASALEAVRVVEMDPWSALAAVGELGRRSGVIAELDMIRPYERRYTPNDPLFGEQWHLNHAATSGLASGVDGRVSEAWDVTLGDPAVILAINDDGVDLEHPEFADKLEPELNYPANWKAQTVAGAFGQHGTACAGVAAARADNAVGGAGVCPGCRILPRLLGPSAAGTFQVSDVDIAEGFDEMVDAGAWIISNSWGPTTGNPIYADSSFPVAPLPVVIKTAFEYAETTGRDGKGTVILYASGNSNDVLDAYGKHPTNLAVGAASDVGLKAYYSSFGATMGVVAPSNGGVRDITTSAPNGKSTSAFGGTSSACPYAAGVLGLIFSANPALTAAEARAILRASATKIDPVWGAWEEGLSPFYGSGLVNAFVAVQMAKGVCADPAECPAPSDVCGASCGTVLPCGVCRTSADCVAGSVCQALPSLGATVCVAAKGAEACPPGTQEHAGFCVPTAATCGACGAPEACNGSDEDCDGLVDEGACGEDPPRCFIDADGCGEGHVCAATRCAKQCANDEECGESERCKKVKDQYGAISGVKACVRDNASQCQVGCEVLAASLDDEPLAEFVECMKDGKASCGAIFSCASKLPVNIP